MTTRENIRVAISAIRGQMLRTVLTILIIAFGIMALVGILTSIDALKGSISSSFSSMGSNSFTIRNSGMNIHMGGKSKRAKRHPKITYYQALEFSERFKYPSQVSVSTMADQIGVIKFENTKSNPNITVMGVDPNYLDVSGYTLASGRNLTQHDLEEGLHVCLLGKELVDKLFNKTNPIDKIVSVGPAKYRVVGTLGEKGSSMGFGGDKVCLIPLSNAKLDYGSENSTYSITVKLKQITDLEPATGEATSMMRNVRKDRIGEDNSFEVTQSDSLAGMVIESMSTVTFSATIIGIITLLGASIGLMNIMLVSVTERTREIGIRKSLGATRNNIRKQFLTEAIVICQLGGITGVILGVLIGNLISMAVGGAFIIPWDWIALGFSVCFLVGLVAGIYPAIKASNLDPIEALRYE
ncbi:MAG: ABC transporter permease [Bacteroidia bacterium]|jgi:putative ABC transport system permease protein|nr:ABC transporter permease [Bacteroidia bacterium]MBP7245245.1 ABC transporter permease [Bacteroidia bacterium]